MNNFHTHTYRCQHAVGTDREYVEKAIQEGFDVFGFSDHSPWPYKDYVSDIRMPVSQFANYIESIRSLRTEFEDRIDLKIGLECEYFRTFFSWLDDIKEEYSLDYLILGNHFIGDEQTGLYSGKATLRKDLYRYLDEIDHAMRDGRFAYLCHPDIIFSSYAEFDESCIDISKKICELSLSYDFPLEYNILGLQKRTDGKFKGLGYPCRDFWEIVQQEGCKVIVGLDAHDPSAVDGSKMKEVLDELGTEGFNLIDTIF
ncbi:MAG: histidinol-phosphatase [Spirochaetales bacterium]|nr:histidinol-phosphatase [Spirochaetales bacterium]